MAIGIDADTEYARRSSIPSGGTGTLSGGGFSDFFIGVWCYRPSAGNSNGLTSLGYIISGVAGAREIKLGFDNTFGDGTYAGPLLQVVFNSGGGTGSVQTYASANFVDEWVYYFFYEDSSNNHVAGYIRLSDLNTAVTISRANDNAGSQYINTLTFGNHSAGSTCTMGHYAYARARNSSSISASDVLTWAASTSTASGDWGFWPLDDNTDTADDSGNSRTLTFSSGLSSETSPSISSGVSGTITITSGNDTMSASGNVGVLGTITITSGDDTLASIGTTSVQGTIAITNGNDTLAASGSAGSPVSGTVTITSGDDTLAAAGTTTVVGTVAITSGNDTLSAAGSTQVLGTISITNGDDSFAASGAVGSAVGGSIAIISGNDTLAAVGNVGILGTITITNGDDSMAAVGNVGVRGTIAIQNGNDSMSAFGVSGTPPAGGLWKQFGYFMSKLGF